MSWEGEKKDTPHQLAKYINFSFSTRRMRSRQSRFCNLKNFIIFKGFIWGWNSSHSLKYCKPYIFLVKCVQQIVFRERKSRAAPTLDRGQYCPSAPEPFVKTRPRFSDSFLDNNFLPKRLLKVLLHLFSSNNHALCVVCLRAGMWERPPWPFTVWLCEGAALTLLGGSEGLSAPLLWSSTKHTGAALGGLWIFYISSTLSVWTQIYLSSHPLALRLSWSFFHSVHPDGFYRLDFSWWFFFQCKDVTLYFRH